MKSCLENVFLQSGILNNSGVGNFTVTHTPWPYLPDKAEETVL